MRKLSWKFWGKEGRGDGDSTIDRMREQLTQIGELVTLLSAQVTGSSEQMAEIGTQVNKVARIQYKTSQDVQGKLERLNAGMDALQQWQAVHDIDAARLHTLERQNNFVAEVLIRWLDDIDLVCARLQGEGQETWRQLLEEWAGQLSLALDEIGIRELDLVGRSFDPQWGDSIGTVARDPSRIHTSEGGNGRPYVPYEVVEVIKRGFVSSDGRLLRKAQVITLREEVSDEQKQ